MVNRSMRMGMALPYAGIGLRLRAHYARPARCVSTSVI